ncbi:MAG: tetratricopeptide repeat protein [Phycisphaerales bacterium]|nr:MAG: tetratricopeptide repeat protein [Phycisphaerales bacterium]
MGPKHSKKRGKSRSRGRRSAQGRAVRGRAGKRRQTATRASRVVSDRKRAKAEERKQITRRRLWLFRFAAITVVPTLLLLSLGIGLRLAGYGYASTVTVKSRVNGAQGRGDNVKFGWRFFPRNISQEFDPFVFASDKPDNTYRIFVLGASAAQGTPDPAYSFGRILRVMLENAYPSADFEVIVAAMPAINSHVAVEIAKDLAEHHPDLFVVYMGNDEVVGPYGAGTVFTPMASNLSLIRMGIALKATRLGQLLARLSELLGAGHDRPRVWRGLEMFLNQQVRASDPGLETVYEHFKANLEDICDVADEAAAKLVLCTVGTNLKDCPPFASLHRKGLSEAEKEQWDRIYREAATSESAGDYSEAVASYLTAAEVDDRFADLQFRLGRCYWAMGEYDKARDRFVEARELDALRFRADARINDILRAVARDNPERGVHLADAARVFAENSPHAVAGEELFHEHVHLNFSGNYLLAKMVFEQIMEQRPKRATSDKAGERPLLSEQECAGLLAYNDWARYNTVYKILNYYLKKPPFTNQLYHDEQLGAVEQRLEALEAGLTAEALREIAAQYRRLIEADPSDVWLRWRYAELLSVRLRSESAAAEQCRAIVSLLPHSHKPHLLLAMSLRRLGRTGEAIEHLQIVTRIKPTSGNAYHSLGLAHQAQGRTDMAIRSYRKALQIHPNNTHACANLAQLLAQDHKVSQAVQVCREGLQVTPDDAGLHYALGCLLHTLGRSGEAAQELRAALRIDPNLAEARQVLDALAGR